MKRFGLSALAVAALSLNACVPDYLETNNSQVIMRISKVSSEAGEDAEASDFLNSDVVPVFNDNAVLTVQVVPKNPTVEVTSRFNDVMIERYEVRYFRSDGRNQEGVDVPFRITGALGTVIPVGGQADVAFIVVRHQAKLEPPLRNLAFVSNLGTGGGLDILTAVADITLHGRTTRGEGVTATARLMITFADFADDTTEPSSTVPASSIVANPTTTTTTTTLSPQRTVN